VGSQTGQSYMRPHSHYTTEEYENSYWEHFFLQAKSVFGF
jgi:hypothetical protein